MLENASNLKKKKKNIGLTLELWVSSADEKAHCELYCHFPRHTVAAVVSLNWRELHERPPFLLDVDRPSFVLFSSGQNIGPSSRPHHVPPTYPSVAAPPASPVWNPMASSSSNFSRRRNHVGGYTRTFCIALSSPSPSIKKVFFFIEKKEKKKKDIKEMSSSHQQQQQQQQQLFLSFLLPFVVLAIISGPTPTSARLLITALRTRRRNAIEMTRPSFLRANCSRRRAAICGITGRPAAGCTRCGATLGRRPSLPAAGAMA